MEAVKSDGPIIVDAADTDDILVLKCYAHGHNRKTNQWIMQIGSERFVSVNLIVNHYGTKICNILSTYHSTTGCDATSYPANVSKVKPHKSIINFDKEHLLADFSQSCSNETVLQEAMTFLQTIMYAAKEKETITQAKNEVKHKSDFRWR